MIKRFAKLGLSSPAFALSASVVHLQLLAQTTITCTATIQEGNTVLITWNTAGEKTYTLESKTTVAAPWESGAELIATNGFLSWTVPIEAATGFFRVVERALVPAPPGMVLIPAGTFQMGDSFGEGESNERPVHTVNVSAFYLDRYEVTKRLWDEVYEWANGHGYRFDYPGSGKATHHPVQLVSWYDVLKWCNARSEKEGRRPAYSTSSAQTNVYRTGRLSVRNDWVNWHGGYRLPTEAEWEYAARGGLSGRRFPWGDTISHSQANYYSRESSYAYDLSPTRGYHPTYRTGGWPYTSPVGSFGANGYGVYDMAGNVWEWCWDWFGGFDASASSDPRGPSVGLARVLRGGYYDNDAGYCRVSHRMTTPWLEYGSESCGFRSALPPGQ